MLVLREGFDGTNRVIVPISLIWEVIAEGTGMGEERSKKCWNAWL